MSLSFAVAWFIFGWRRSQGVVGKFIQLIIILKALEVLVSIIFYPSYMNCDFIPKLVAEIVKASLR